MTLFELTEDLDSSFFVTGVPFERLAFVDLGTDLMDNLLMDE